MEHSRRQTENVLIQCEGLITCLREFHSDLPYDYEWKVERAACAFEAKKCSVQQKK